MLLVMNLYGLPQGGRLWEQQRNKVILSEFNDDQTGYTCKRSRREPCLFYIRKGHDKAYMIIHTDDCDMVGTSDDILGDIHRRLSKRL